MIKKYTLKAVVVEAVLLSTDNIKEVERWCKGSIKGTSLPVHEQVIEMYTPDDGEVTAEIGDMVVKFSDGYCSKMNVDRFHELYQEAK